MKNNIFPKILIVLIALVVSSCGVTTQKAMRTTTFMPDYVEMNISLDDFKLIGESEVSVSYNTYVGVFRVINEINGKEVARRTIHNINTYGRTWLPIGGYLRRALYDVAIEYPQADLFIPAYIISEQEKMFGGRKVKKTMKVKVFEIRETTD